MRVLIELDLRQFRVMHRALSVAAQAAAFQSVMNGETDSETAKAYAAVKAWLVDGAREIVRELDSTALGDGQEQVNYLLNRDKTNLQEALQCDS